MQAIIANTIGYIKIYVKNTHNSEIQPVLYCFSFHRLPSLGSLSIGKSTSFISNRQIIRLENDCLESPMVYYLSIFNVTGGQTPCVQNPSASRRSAGGSLFYGQQ